MPVFVTRSDDSVWWLIEPACALSPDLPARTPSLNEISAEGVLRAAPRFLASFPLFAPDHKRRPRECSLRTEADIAKPRGDL
jgi:hypothetical protein